MIRRIGDAIPTRAVRHAAGPDLVHVDGMVGCYVHLTPTSFHSGNVDKFRLILTPQESRDLAYQLRVMADSVDEILTPGRMR